MGNNWTILNFMCFLLLTIVITSATYSSLNIATNIETTDGDTVNSVILKNKLSIDFKIAHHHHLANTTGLSMQILFRNNNNEPVIINSGCISIRSKEMDFTKKMADASYNDLLFWKTYKNKITDTSIVVLPGDSLLLRIIYSNNFKGNFKTFKYRLSKTEIFFDVDSILLEKQYINIKDLKLIPVVS